MKLAANHYGSGQVLITSFTRAAAAEIAGRDLPISPHQIGTLHAHCFRAMNRPKIAETQIDRWNEEHPDRALRTGRGGDLDEADTEEAGDTEAELSYAKYQIYRARMTPRQEWDATTLTFAAEWEAWKFEEGLRDFSDLIAYCYDHVDEAPGNPSAIFGDELQDMSRAEMALLRKWAANTEAFYGAADSDQALYSFKGSDGKAFWQHPIPPEHKRVLDQSYRLPRKVQRYALDWIGQIADREPVTFRPRDVEGEIVESAAEWSDPSSLVDLAEREAARNKSVMILTTCSYMLYGVVAELRERGIPYHNPFRTKRGDWNPLGGGRGVTAAQRLLAYLRPQEHLFLDKAQAWTATDIEQWAAPLEAKGILKRGAKAWLAEQSKSERTFTPEELRDKIADEALQYALDGDLDWYAEHLLDSKKKVFRYPLRVVERTGVRGLMQKPRVIVGTVHSVKGGEASTVILCPDLSPRGWTPYSAGSGDGWEATIRCLYVGMTRAREKLILCANATGTAVSWPDP